MTKSLFRLEVLSDVINRSNNRDGDSSYQETHNNHERGLYRARKCLRLLLDLAFIQLSKVG
jgi:hypothetical protein